MKVSETFRAAYPENFCPLCGEPLEWFGSDPMCHPCIIKGKGDEVDAAIEARKS